jgi:hypothetical protein
MGGINARADGSVYAYRLILTCTSSRTLNSMSQTGPHTNTPPVNFHCTDVISWLEDLHGVPEMECRKRPDAPTLARAAADRFPRSAPAAPVNVPAARLVGGHHQPDGAHPRHVPPKDTT